MCQHQGGSHCGIAHGGEGRCGMRNLVKHIVEAVNPIVLWRDGLWRQRSRRMAQATLSVHVAASANVASGSCMAQENNLARPHGSQTLPVPMAATPSAVQSVAGAPHLPVADMPAKEHAVARAAWHLLHVMPMRSQGYSNKSTSAENTDTSTPNKQNTRTKH